MCSNEELQSMCDHYGTTVGECNCSDNKLESANFEIDIPCCHRLFLGETFPDLPEIKFIFEYDNTLNYETIFAPAELIHHQKGYSEKQY